MCVNRVVYGFIFGMSLLASVPARAQAIRYVDDDAPAGGNGTTWATSFKYLQDALAAAAVSGSGINEIRVAQGTYKPDRGLNQTLGNRSATFQLQNGVALKGGYAGIGAADPDVRDALIHESILSGDLNSNDELVSDLRNLWSQPSRGENSYHVVTTNNNDATAVLDGFTVTQGNANGTASASSSGGGLFMSASRAGVINCKFAFNSASSNGGAIQNSSGQSTLSRSTFIGNSAQYGGGMATNFAQLTLIDCRFFGNLASPGVGGGMRNSNSTLVLSNCLLSGNLSANSGGAISNFLCNVNLKNCTISGNVAKTWGGGFSNYQTSASISMTNCVIWGNIAPTGPQLYNAGGPQANVTYSCVQSGFPGTGNIGSDPRFVDADGIDNEMGTEDDNGHLQPGSPCLDTGNNTPLGGLPSTDLDGKPRISNTVVDLGAYEGPHQVFVVSGAPVNVPELGTTVFTVALGLDPLQTVAVTVARHSGDNDISVINGHTLNFDSSNYSQPQVVTLEAADDTDFANGSAIFRISGNGVPSTEIKAHEVEDDPLPTVVFVKSDAVGNNSGTSWENAFVSLQNALEVVASVEVRPATIWVAAGIYRPDNGDDLTAGDREAAFKLRSGIALYGGFAGNEDPETFDVDDRDIQEYPSVLSGDLAGNDIENFINNDENSFCVVAATGVDATAVLDGFTISGGNANALDWPGEFRKGGGIYLETSSPTLLNCHIVSNWADVGGAMFNGPLSNPVLSNCKFIQNFASHGGGIGGDNSNPVLRHCDFSRNKATGGGGGMYITGYGHLRLTHCSFTGNTANNGGGIYVNYSNAALVNCTFSGNSATGGFNYGGGAMSNVSSDELILINCTFTHNSAIYGGGALDNHSGSEPLVSNCIFWKNVAPRGPQIYAADTGSYATVKYSCVEGGFTGIGNIPADPLFVDAMGPDHISGTDDDNLRLRGGSPCIDAGENATVPLDLVSDLDGNLRIADDPIAPNVGSGTPPIVDMGAYEGAHQAFIVSNSTVHVPEKGTAQFVVSLAMDPLESVEVRVALQSGDTDISVVGSPILSFDSTNYSVPQAVTLLAAYDLDHQDGAAFLSITAGGLPTAVVLAFEIDAFPPLFVDDTAIGANDGSSWHNAFRNLQDALSAAAANSTFRQIWVAAGIYKPDRGLNQTAGNRNATFLLLNGVDIFGGLKGDEDPVTFDLDDRELQVHRSVLSGDLNGNDGANFANDAENSFHVVTGTATDIACVLDGFSVTGGNANGSSLDAGRGGGFFLGYNSNMTLRNCLITKNRSKDKGGGMYCHYSIGVIAHCIFEGNSTVNGGAGTYNTYGIPTFLDCTFIQNTGGSGAGMNNDNANTKVIRCIFRDNQGTGLYNNRCDPTVLNCAFINNQTTFTGGGGMYNLMANPRVTNCTFVNNIASAGAGIYDNASHPTVTNCTFSGNTANILGGAFYEYQGSGASLNNCIVWGNKDPNGVAESSQIHRSSGTSFTVNYSCIQGLTGSLNGTKNIGSDPQFVNAAVEDVHLSIGSPCNDAGNNVAVPADIGDINGNGNITEAIPFDLDGNLRLRDDPTAPDTGSGASPLVDMGAYETFPDCNKNNVFDWIETSSGTSGDCNHNSMPDECEPDTDGDSIIDGCDMCPAVPYANNTDTDSDGVGDACDNCPNIPNNDQDDVDADGRGDACDNDMDGDGLSNAFDNCPLMSNAGQENTDGDPLGDACDQCPASTPGAIVDATGCTPIIPGDFDSDGDVDLTDFGHLQVCLSGNTIAQNDISCINARLDTDTDVDASDVNIFLPCMRGANIPADPNCTN